MSVSSNPHDSKGKAYFISPSRPSRTLSPLCWPQPLSHRACSCQPHQPDLSEFSWLPILLSFHLSVFAVCPPWNSSNTPFFFFLQDFLYGIILYPSEAASSALLSSCQDVPLLASSYSAVQLLSECLIHVIRNCGATGMHWVELSKYVHQTTCNTIQELSSQPYESRVSQWGFSPIGDFEAYFSWRITGLLQFSALNKCCWEGMTWLKLNQISPLPPKAPRKSDNSISSCHDILEDCPAPWCLTWISFNDKDTQGSRTSGSPLNHRSWAWLAPSTCFTVGLHDSAPWGWRLLCIILHHAASSCLMCVCLLLSQ